MAKVVRLKRHDGKIIQNCDVYIGRCCNMGGWRLKTSKWCNPYSVKKYGRDEAIKMYEDYVRNNEDLMKDLSELEGKILGCWCKPQPCHGDVLVSLLKEKSKESKKDQTKERREEETTELPTTKKRKTVS